MMIQAKPRSLWEYLKESEGEGSSKSADTVKASHGLFERLKKPADLHNIHVTEEAASADTMMAEHFPAELKHIIEE